MHQNDPNYQRAKKVLQVILSPNGEILGKDKYYRKFFSESIETALEAMPSSENIPSDERFATLLKEALLLMTVSPSFEAYARRESFIEVKKLGKPLKSINSGVQDEERDLEQLSERMARSIASYDEPVSLHVFHTGSEGEYSSAFVLSSAKDGAGDRDSAGKVLTSLIRSVYGYVETKAYSGSFSVDSAETQTIYGLIRIPYRDHEVEREQENRCSWLTAVANTLPLVKACHLRVQCIPMRREDQRDDIQKRYDILCALRDGIQSGSETDWNHSSAVNGNQQFVPRLSHLASKFKDSIDGTTHSAGVSETFGETKHEKNKYAELLIKEIDQELYRLNRALITRAWTVQIMLTAAKDDTRTLQTIAGAMSGALKGYHYDLTWSSDKNAAMLAGTEEILPLISFPTREMIGLEFVKQDEFSLSSPAEKDEGVPLGKILWNGIETDVFYLKRSALTRHAFVCGMTGGGKTNTVFRIIEEIERPFLVIEPVKGEYRGLKKVYPDLQLYTTRFGDCGEGIRLLRMNPFWFPPGSSLAFHIDSIKTVIASSFEMSAAMPNILEQCLYKVYVKFGWSFITNQNIYAGSVPEEYLYPTFSDLLVEIDDYLDKAEFGDEVKGNYRGAMSSRLRSFIGGSKGVLLNTTVHPDYAQFGGGRFVIELEGLADDSDKCLVMGALLVQYFEYVKATFNGTDKGLHHIMVIEEAHRLFKNVSKQSSSSEGANVVGQLVETLSNIMAEIRAFGEGMLIVDQSPTKIADDVIKNSGTKIIHRIDNNDDCEMLHASLLVSKDDNTLPALRAGEALVRSEGMTRPCKVIVDHAVSKDKYSLSDSFRITSEQDQTLQYEFLAATLISDEKLTKRIQKLVLTLLYSLSLSDTDEYWEEALRVTADMVEQECIKPRNLDKYVTDINEFSRFYLTMVTRLIDSYYGSAIFLEENCMMRFFIDRTYLLYIDSVNGQPVKNHTWKILHHVLNSKLRRVLDLIDRSLEESENGS